MAPSRFSTSKDQDDQLSSPPSSPALSVDKENHYRQRPQGGKRKSDITMAHDNSVSSSGSKRRRLAELQGNMEYTQTRASQRAVTDYYDPDQDVSERREIRKGLRDLQRDLNDCRSEYLQSGNKGILNTIQKANDLFTRVKQTSDATVDSQLLVNAADLSYKKSARLALDGAAAGIDVDEFVSKCLSFMRQTPSNGASNPLSSTHRRRANGDDSDDEGVDDTLNWDRLGRAACFPYNARPSLSGFLLGPLSVQKRTRQVTQRRVANQIDRSQVVRPQDLEEQDLDRQESSNLTAMCTKISKLLQDVINSRQAAVNAEMYSLGREPTMDELYAAMDKHQIAENGGILLYPFAINPKSFGQTIENLFYISFLIRDGNVGISQDSHDFVTLHSSTPYPPLEAQEKGIQKHQLILNLNFEIWHDLIESFDIKESIIPHRNDEEFLQQNQHGWYN
ncbi:nuclear protein Qri2/Nse4, putative [Talaromyces stipitatus ATCC 10500]|uniref:Non-structural maintenance of chromosomes element 4 n=1 Tax=Talaromyces stipitatus (strain ATCC 10500 / CBS 375.48 / QM 6759 / NRRL 1006) TaxID=441959 RepID=B8MDA1_TALSN|nr:nuclear protein Qri2/Nse4, putative [Talaromyces stipitatus ATCC 10500]EED17626.1 nuclear protein Qri2/Nse4, putative [Talaromyces stipitatus ATCC 10500]